MEARWSLGGITHDRSRQKTVKILKPDLYLRSEEIGIRRILATLLGESINATDEEEHLGLLARQHQLEGAAINAMDDAHHLRNLVQWQENEIMELNNRLEGRSNLVVNNPGEAGNVTDSDHGPVVHFAEEPFHWTDDQSYHRASKRKGNLFKYFVSTVFKENRARVAYN